MDVASKRTQLEEVIAAWPNLPGHIKAAIRDIVLANTIYMDSWVLWPGQVSRLRGDDRDHEGDHRTVHDVKRKHYSKCKQWKDETQFYRKKRQKGNSRHSLKKVVIGILIGVGIGKCLMVWFLLPNRIEFLGHHYSPKLCALYERVCEIHKKPIRIVEISGDIDNSIECLHKKEVVLRLHRGCSEDNIAHELMHAVLRAEGYPNFFAITNPLSAKIHNICSADLDHIIINDRLLELGYDARQGFLKEVNGYDNVLKLHADEDLNRQAILQFNILYELMKFHYYIGIPSAQAHILERFPEVTEDWRQLSTSIDDLPQNPKPQDMWNIGVEYITLGDAICANLGVWIRISDLIGLEPIPLHKNQLNKPAKSLFTQSTEVLKEKSQGRDSVLLRTFYANPRIMLSAYICWADDPGIEEINQLSVRRLSERRSIRYLLVE